MKKTIKILSFVALFIGLMLLHSSVSAASNGIVVRKEKDLNCVRTDVGNTTTLELKEGEYYQEADTLSANFKKALEGGELISKGHVYYYIPLPENFDTNYKNAKFFEIRDGKKTLDTPYYATFVDANFEQIPCGNDNENPHIQGAKYIQLSTPVIGRSVGNVDRVLGSKKTIELTYYDKNNKATTPVQYTMIVKPRVSSKYFKVELAYNKNSSSILYNGQGSSNGQPSSYSPSIQKGTQPELRVTNTSYDWKEDLTSKTKFTVEDETILTVSKEGKITAKKPGSTSVKVEIDDVSVTININVYVETYFEDTITKEQINDLIEQAKISNWDEIYYSTTKDTILPTELLKAAKELKKDLVIGKYEDDFYYTWVFKAEDITDTNMNVDLKIEKVACFIDELKDRKDVMFLDFKHSGKLPGKATITIAAEDGDNVKTEDGYLYYYNETTKKLEYISVAKRNEYGETTFSLEHCSKYVNSDTKLDETTSNRKLDAGEPKAGEENYIVLASLAIIVSLAGMVIVKKQQF